MHFISSANFWIIFFVSLLSLVAIVVAGIVGFGIIRKTQVETMDVVNKALNTTNEQLLKRVQILESNAKKTGASIATLRLENEGRRRRLESAMRHMDMMEAALNFALAAMIRHSTQGADELSGMLAKIKIERTAEDRAYSDWEVTQKATISYIDEHLELVEERVNGHMEHINLA